MVEEWFCEGHEGWWADVVRIPGKVPNAYVKTTEK